EAFADATRVAELVLAGCDAESTLARELSGLAARIAEAGGRHVSLRRAEGPEPVVLPALSLGNAGRVNIHYHVMPEGLEAAPFLELLRALTGEPPPELKGARAEGERDLVQKLVGLASPAEILVFVSTACPHCAQVVRAALEVALASPAVSCAIIDAQLFPRLAERYEVQAVPLTLIDGTLALRGALTASELASHLLARGSSEYQARAFLSLVERGCFDEAAARTRCADGARYFANAWLSSSLGSRLGLFVVAERVIEAEPRALEGVVGELCRALGAPDAALRGDTADLLGQIRAPSAREALRGLLDDENPEVAEIAAEALEKIAGRGRTS
ncbi:MAG: thioredoxin family protein, partial [Planctomycetota bacterium]